MTDKPTFVPVDKPTFVPVGDGKPVFVPKEKQVDTRSPFWKTVMQGAMEAQASQPPKFVEPEKTSIQEAFDETGAIKLPSIGTKILTGVAGMGNNQFVNKALEDVEQKKQDAILKFQLSVMTTPKEERQQIIDNSDIDDDWKDVLSFASKQTDYVSPEELQAAYDDPASVQRDFAENAAAVKLETENKGVYPILGHFFKMGVDPVKALDETPDIYEKLYNNFVGAGVPYRDKKELIQHAIGAEENFSGKLTRTAMRLSTFVPEMMLTKKLLPDMGIVELRNLGKANKVWSTLVGSVTEGGQVAASQAVFSGQLSPADVKANMRMGVSFHIANSAASNVGTLLFGKMLTKNNLPTRLANAVIRTLLSTTAGTATSVGLSGDYSTDNWLKEGVIMAGLALLANGKISRAAFADQLVARGIEKGEWTKEEAVQVREALIKSTSQEELTEWIKAIKELTQKVDVNKASLADPENTATPIKKIADVAETIKIGKEAQKKSEEIITGKEVDKTNDVTGVTEVNKPGQEKAGVSETAQVDISKQGGEDVAREAEPYKSSLERVNESEIARRTAEQQNSSADIARNAAKEFGQDAEVVAELRRIAAESSDPQARLSAKQIIDIIDRADTKERSDTNEAKDVLGEMEQSKFTRIKNYVFRQSLKVVKEMGEGGKKLGEKIEAIDDYERSFVGEGSLLAYDSYRTLSNAEKKNFNEIDNAKSFNRPEPMPISKKVKDMVDTYDRSYADAAAEAMRMEVKTTDETGVIRDFTPLPNYRPRIPIHSYDELGVKLKKNGEPFSNKKRESILESMVRNGRAHNKAEAAFKLDNYINSKKARKSGNIEFSRRKLSDISEEEFMFPDEFYVQDAAEKLIAYRVSVGKRLAHIKEFGATNGKAEKLLDQIKEEGYNERFARSLFRYETGQLTDAEQRYIRAVNTMKGWQALTKFTPFTTLRNGFQGFLGSSTRGNLKAGTYGLMKAFTVEGKRNAIKSGALVDHMERIIQSELSGEGTLVSQWLRTIGFTQTDAFNRIVSASAGEVFYKDMLGRLKNDSILRGRALREFKKIGLNAEEIVKRGEFTSDELNLIRRTFAGDAQFNIRPSDLPLFWSSPTGKLLTQWKPFGYKMTQLIRDNIWAETKKGNMAPLTTMLLAYGVAGETVNTIIDYVRETIGYGLEGEVDFSGKKTLKKSLFTGIDEKTKKDVVLRIINDVSSLGMAGLWIDMLRSFGYGKSGATSVALGPTVAEAVQTSENLLSPAGEAMTGDTKNLIPKTIKGAVKVVERNVPGAGLLRTTGVTKVIDKNLKNVLDEIFSEEKEKARRKLKATKKTK